MGMQAGPDGFINSKKVEQPKPLSSKTKSDNEAIVQRPEKGPPARERAKPTVDASSQVKVDLRPQCSNPRPFSARGLTDGDKLSTQYQAMMVLLKKEFPSTFVVSFPVERDKVVRCLFEPDFRNYSRVQKALEAYDFPIELRPACRSRAELESLLNSVKQFIKKEDHVLQVQFSQIDWYSSRIQIALDPRDMGLREKIVHKFGDAIFFDVTHRGVLLHR